MSITPLSADLNIVQSLVIPDLDDDLDVIPFDKIQNFFQTHLR